MPVFGVCRETTKNTPVSARTFGGISTHPETEKRRQGAKIKRTCHCVSNQPRQGTVSNRRLAPTGRGLARFSPNENNHQTMKIAVIGSRMVEKIDFTAIGAQAGDVIVSGGARGADTLAATEARRRGLAVIEFLPDYARFGCGAPLIRNREIVAACDRLVAFWDGKSRGTAYTIREAQKNGKQVQIIRT